MELGSVLMGFTEALRAALRGRNVSFQPSLSIWQHLAPSVFLLKPYGSLLPQHKSPSAKKRAQVANRMWLPACWKQCPQDTLLRMVVVLAVPPYQCGPSPLSASLSLHRR